MRSLQAWIEACGIEAGPLFRSITRHGRIQGRLSGYAVALIVKKYAGGVGLDIGAYSGHSLRSGLATSAAIAGPARALYHGADGPQVGRDGEALHPGFESVPGERRGASRSVSTS